MPDQEDVLENSIPSLPKGPNDLSRRLLIASITIAMIPK